MYVREVNKKSIFSKQYFGYLKTYTQIFNLDLQSLPYPTGVLITTGQLNK